MRVVLVPENRRLRRQLQDAAAIDAAPPVDVSTSCSLPGPGSHTLSIDVDGTATTIGITRVHMEEDTGKSSHMGDGGGRIHVNFNGKTQSRPVLPGGNAATFSLPAGEGALDAWFVADGKQRVIVTDNSPADDVTIARL